MKSFVVPVASILAITVVLVVAMFLGKNGIILAGGIAGLAGLGGYEIKSLVNGRKSQKEGKNAR